MARAVSGGLTRRKVQTVVIFTVLLVSTASATLGLGLLLDSSGPFQHAFAAQRGAEVTASIDPAKATIGQLAATRQLPQVTAAAGPFAEATITPGSAPTTGSPCRRPRSPAAHQPAARRAGQHAPARRPP